MAPERSIDTLRVCFVCSGNICRSPTAEVVLRSKLMMAGLADHVIVDSAGTGGWHAGDDMDARSRRTLHEYGYEPDVHSAKQFRASMFASRHLVVALDGGHVSELTQLARAADDPQAATESIVALRSFDPDARAAGELEVPDPYYGNAKDFRDVVEMIELACDGLVGVLQALLGPASFRATGSGAAEPVQDARSN